MTNITDKEGKTVFPTKKSYSSAVAEYQGNNKSSYVHFSSYTSNRFTTNSSEKSTVKLLTDRTIYRPGQTVYVKGIAYSQSGFSAKVLPDATYTVKLWDANRQEVASCDLTTNEFGSFTTTFELPTACLNGNFMLSVNDNRVYFKVEDYKRPSFEVNINKPDVSYKLGDVVNLSGDAKTFSGVPLSDLKVEYKVTRSYFSGWRYAFLSRGVEVIATGSEMLNADGNFTIPVHLKQAEDDIARQFGCYYTYTVQASVTNLAGETQSATYFINAGTRSMLLSTDLGKNVLKSDSLQTLITARNLNGGLVDVKGQYMLYAMRGDETYDEAKNRAAVLTADFQSNQSASLATWSKLSSGKYLLVVEAKDNNGQLVSDEQSFVLFSTSDKCPPVKSEKWYYAENTEFDAQHPASFYFGTSFKDTYVLMNILADGKVIESRTMQLTDTIVHYKYAYKPIYGNGVSINFCFVKEGKMYQENVVLKRRLPDTKLTMKWEVFRDKLRPGQNEEWRLTIKRPDGAPADAEMLATMYDASLDKIYPNNQTLELMYNLRVPTLSWSQTPINGIAQNWYAKLKRYKYPELAYDYFAWNPLSSDILEEVVVAYGVRPKRAMEMSLSSRVNGANPQVEEEIFDYIEKTDSATSQEALPEAPEDLRTNLAETAFFYPFLRTNEAGEVVLSFTMPQSLTSWNFRGYSHNKEMFTGRLDATAVTAKDFMLSPYMPRFVRVGDETTIAATIANVTDKAISGSVSMTLFNPENEKVVLTRKQSFSVAAKQTIGVDFNFTVPQGYELLGCRMIADGGEFSDGEQQILPVLSDKVRLTQSVAMPIKGNETRTFDLNKLFNNHSKSATNRSLTVEFTGNPAWYAVQALPTLVDPIYNNAINWAAANYANSLAECIANSQPRIAEMVAKWKEKGGTKETLISQLQKNQELKTIILSESPWVLEAQSQQEQMERLSTLFDIHAMRNKTITALTRLKELQLPDGSWTWFKGMQGSYSVTQYIATLNARQAMLTGNKPDVQLLRMQKSALKYLNQELLSYYAKLTKKEKQDYQLPSWVLHYFYLATISGEDIASSNEEAHKFFMSCMETLLPSASMKSKAMAAIVLEKSGKHKAAMEFIASMKEHLSTTVDGGMYFKSTENIYGWEGSPLETQVYAMEAFGKVSNDKEVVEAMKLWLLMQKQTQAWRTPIATADAIYGLLMTGDNLLANTGDVRITLGGKTINTNNETVALPGLNYVKETFEQKSVVNAKSATVQKVGEGIAWGAVYAQYEEALSAVEKQGEGMSITKKLYVERYVDNKRQLFPIEEGTQLSVGDIVISVLNIKLTRAMQFLQLKDQRAACFEPIAVLSGYRWSNGFGFYQDIKDASTNFFFDSLGKGEFQLQHSYRVSRSGVYETGIATLQCAYAPEYTAHSSSSKVKVE